MPEFRDDAVRLKGTRHGEPFTLRAKFIIDATGPDGYLARALAIPSGMERMQTRASIVFSHFTGVRSTTDVVVGLPEGPYADERAAVHHLIDEGWMYSLGFDHAVTSAGFLLTPGGMESTHGR